MRLTWLLRLYPPAWQRRYRKELKAHLQAEPANFRTALDLMAGAVDAWTNPASIPATEHDETENGKEHNMLTAARCRSTEISGGQARRSAAWMLGTTLFLVVVSTYLDKTVGPHVLIEALLMSSFFIALTISSRSTFLRPYSWAARNVIIALVCVAWYAFFVAVGYLGTLV